MGRTILIEKVLQDQINQLIGSNPQHVGLLIGQVSLARDYAIHLARCPDPVDDEVEVASCSDDNVEIVKSNSKKAKTKTSNSSLSDVSEIDPKWIVEHARQVSGMLTGGMSVLGIYMISPPDMFMKTQVKLKQCLQAINKKIEKHKSLRNSLIHNEKYLVHICSLSRKFTCRTIDLNDEHASLKPVDYRVQSFLDNWMSVSTCVDIDIQCCVPLSQEVCRTEQKVMYACEKEIGNILKSHASIGYKVLEENQLLENNKLINDDGDIDIYLFKDSGSSICKSANVASGSVIAQVKFVGSILAKAFLHPKATCGEAVKALKVDIIRSLLTRVQLLCEEAEVNNLCHVDEWSLMSPARVFAPFHNYNLYFSDYIFKDESGEDSIGRFSELLNLKLLEEKLLFLEQSPDASVASMVFLGDKPIDHLSDVASEISMCLEEPRDRKVLAIAVATITTLFAVAFHFLSR